MQASEGAQLPRIAVAFLGPMPGQPGYPSVASPVSAPLRRLAVQMKTPALRQRFRLQRLRDRIARLFRPVSLTLDRLPKLAW